MTPIHPGYILKEEFMVPLNMSANQLALRLHVPTGRVTQIINGQRSISADSALRLSRYFGTTPQFWLNLQSRYDLQVAQDKAGEVVAETIIPYELETKK
ncbi:MAG: HigA family addiction module antitoxin [Candidatus Melainabacteria bacterium]|nr:HigA family addiction module antitoxin [Candidatus Melainabacteria bacterium]